MSAPERPEPDLHPLVATRALLSGSQTPLPSSVGVRPATGQLWRPALDVAVAIGEALFSRDGEHAPPADRIAWVREQLGDLMSRTSGLGRLQIGAALLLIGWLSPLFDRSLPPLTRLPVARRVSALERFEAGPGAPLLIAVRALLCLVYYEHPDAAAEIGADTQGPPEGRLLPWNDAPERSA